MKILENEVLLLGMEAETFAAEVVRLTHSREMAVSDSLEAARGVLSRLSGEGLIKIWVAYPLDLNAPVDADTDAALLLSRSDWLLDSVGEDGLSLVFETTPKGQDLVRRRLGWEREQA